MQGRQLHEFILTQIERRLGDRTWAWLARDAQVPRSTLMTQKGRPKFSVEVILRVAGSLDCAIEDLLPSPGQPGGRRGRGLIRELHDAVAARDAGATGPTTRRSATRPPPTRRGGSR